MGFWDTSSFDVAGRTASKKESAGRPRRTKFGIVRYAGEGVTGHLVIPADMGITAGQRVRYVETPDGFAFRIADDGDHPVRKRSTTGRSLMAFLPEPLAAFATGSIVDLDTEPFEGGWLVRYAQLEGRAT